MGMMNDVWDEYDPAKWTGVYPGFYGHNMHVTQSDMPEEAVARMFHDLNGDEARYKDCVLFPPHSGRDLADALDYYGINESNYGDYL